MNTKGFVYLIGAGPGDPGLLTIKGCEVLKKADVVIYDRLVGFRIMDFAKEEAELIYVGKASGNHAMSQDEINHLLVQKASEGKVVARLKGGDPFVFGRGGEEALYIRENGYDFEIIPGITSAIAVPAYAGIPVTHRDATSSFAIITGHEKPDKTISSIHWDKISTGIGTLVFLMGLENLTFIVENLIANGRAASTPVAVIHKGTLPEQEVVTGTLLNIVEQVREAGLKPPAIIVVGETVSLREALKWIEKKPLWGKSILVTRARAQASQLLQKIRDLGGEAIEFPAIKIEKEEDLQPLYEAFQGLQLYNWLIFTSVNAVDIFFEELRNEQIDIRSLVGLKLCAIGPATADRLENKGLYVDIVPVEFSAEGILKAIDGAILPGHKVLLPRAKGARELLPEQLRQIGAEVNEVWLYESILDTHVNPDLITRVREARVDYICFTSSSTVTNFVQMLGEEQVASFNERVRVACIGPITGETAGSNGFSVDVMAREYTIEGLLEAILEDINFSARNEEEKE